MWSNTSGYAARCFWTILPQTGVAGFLVEKLGQ